MADLHERVAQLEVRAEEHEKNLQDSCIQENKFTEKFTEIAETLASIKTATENLSEKTDGINARLDRLNGSVTEIKMNKVDKPDFAASVEVIHTQSKLSEKLKNDIKWIVIIGGALAVLLMGHIGYQEVNPKAPIIEKK